MLSTQILVQSYYLDAFSFHLSVKSHVFHVMCTDFCSILYLDTFSVHLSVKFHFTIVKYTDFSSIIYLDTFSVHLSVKFHFTIVKYTDFSSILYLDAFSFHLSVKSHVFHVITQILVQSYTWIHFHSIFLLNLMFFHVMYTDVCSILYLDTFSVHLSVKSHVTMLSTQI